MDKKYVKDYIARRVANELKDGFVVNLGVGLPTLCTKYLPEGVKICIDAELGIVGQGATPMPGDANYDPLNVVDAGGYGLGAVVTPTGVDTLVEKSPFCLGRQTIEGRDYLLMKPVTADWAIVKGAKVDKVGNVWYKGTGRNFAPYMAAAAKHVIVEAEQIVEVGEILPEDVVTPGILVDYIVEVQK